MLIQAARYVQRIFPDHEDVKSSPGTILAIVKPEADSKGKQEMTESITNLMRARI